jgi:hypothetical protein
LNESVYTEGGVAGKLTLVKAEQLENAYWPILVAFGRSTLVKALQEVNAYCPTVVTASLEYSVIVLFSNPLVTLGVTNFAT